MTVFARTGAPLALLLTLLPPLVLSYRPEFVALSTCAGILSLCAFISARRGGASKELSPSFGLVIGAATPLLAWIGPSFTLTLSAIYAALLLRHRTSLSSLMWASPLLAYLLGSVFMELSLATPFIARIPIDTFARLHDVANALVTTQAPSWMYLSRVSVFVLLVTALVESNSHRTAYARGAFWGCAAAGFFAALSYLGIFSLPTQTSFWTSLNRIAGTMSDPNALGVMMGLALWLLALIAPARALSLPATLSIASPIVAGGLVAGSRTFIIALGLLVLFKTLRLSRRLAIAVLGLGIAIVTTISILDTSTTLIQTVISNDGIPETVRRTVSSLSLQRVEESLFSRSVFLAISAEMIESAPFFGVGADRYRGYVGIFAEHLKLPIAGWTDNSNNLYLGIIAELGVVGALAYCLSAYNRRPRERKEAPLARVALLAIAILFITGPHTDFPEVLTLVALLVALTTTTKQRPLSVTIRSATLFIALGCIAPLLREGGTFNWHREIDSLSRWLSPHARINLPCEPSGQERVAKITLQPEYIPSREPLHVSISAGTSEVLLDFTKREELHTTLSCDPSQRSIAVTIDTRPAWSPYRAWPGTNNDHRLMGAQQLIRLSPEPVNIQP